MKTKDFRNLGIVLSLSIVKILNGISAQRARIVGRINIFHRIAEFFGFLYLSLEDLSSLYFYLPEERRLELKQHLDFFAKDFVSWKRFIDMHRYSAKTIKNMALNEMSFYVANFQQAYEGFILADDLMIKKSFLELMEKRAVSFEEKLNVIRSGNLMSEEKLEELFSMIKTFIQAEQFSCLIGLDERNINKGAKKMLSLADDFKKLNRTHRRAIPGSSLRREIVSVADNYELPQNELIQYYYEEKYWSNFKRMLFKKVEKLVLGIEDWLEILLHYGSDRKLKNLAMSKMRLLGLSFYQLNNTLSRAKDPEIKLVILEEMFLLSKGSFEMLNIVSVKSEDFPQVFSKSFSALLELIYEPKEAERACEILAVSKNKNTDFILKLLSLELSFESLDKLFNKAPKEGKILLLPYMRLSAKNNLDNLLKVFTYYSLVDDLKERQRKQNSCLKEALLLGEDGDALEKLLDVYRLALMFNNFTISERVVEVIKRKKYKFETLLKTYENLEKNKITNNGLAAFLQTEMINRAETSSEKIAAFKKAPLQVKNLALSRLLSAA